MAPSYYLSQCNSFTNWSGDNRLSAISKETIKILPSTMCLKHYINGLVQERRESIAIALELRLSRTNLSTYQNLKMHVRGTNELILVSDIYAKIACAPSLNTSPVDSLTLIVLISIKKNIWNHKFTMPIKETMS